jgi:hypothetical protein
VDNPATVKLTHYRQAGSGSVQSSRSGFCPAAISMIDFASWLGSLGRLGWLVIPAFYLGV